MTRYAEHALREVWAPWWLGRRERGWPRESCEVRAQHAARTATRTDGVARWRGDGAPPQMPKETRPKAHGRIPDLDRAELGPWVDRLLLDLRDEGWHLEVRVLRADALRTEPADLVARGIGMAPRTWRRRRKTGLRMLEIALIRLGIKRH